jgi:hypothetical protein
MKFLCLLLFILGAAIPIAAEQASASFTISAIVTPSCQISTAGTSTGQTTVSFRCATSDIQRARIKSGQPAQPRITPLAPAQPTPGGVPANTPTAQVAVPTGSLIQIDF